MIAQYVYFIAFDTSGRVTGDAANITATLAKEDGAHAALTNNTATEIANGKYRFSLTDAERTGSRFSFDALSSTSGVNVLPVVDVRPVNSLGAAVLDQLSSIEIALASPYSTKTKTLTLVENKDYTATSLVGPLRFEIAAAGAIAGDVVRFGAVLGGAETIESSGVIVDDGGTLYAEIPLTKETHTNRTPTEYGRYELEHINGTGEVSPLISDQCLILLSAHPD